MSVCTIPAQLSPTRITLKLFSPRVSVAAAVTAVYVLVVEVAIRREIPLRKLPEIMRESMVLVGAIMIILGVSLASTNGSNQYEHVSNARPIGPRELEVPQRTIVVA